MIVLFLLAIVLLALALGDLQALLIEHNGLKGIYWLKKLPYFVILV
jgi:hypothetical protein